MNRKLITVVATAGTVFAVYVATGGTVQQQTAELADAGFVTPNRDATCPVRLDEDFAADAGLKVYQRLTFPVVLTVLADGGRDVQMPPMPLQRVRQSIDVVDWNDCTLSASTAPVRAKWGTAQPFTLAPVKPWCRQKADAGLSCRRKETDGGSRDFGDRNVFPCSDAVTPATCERVSSGVIYAGDDEEDL